MRPRLRRAIKRLRARLAALWPELVRLNSIGVNGAAYTRAARSAAFRAALAEKHRNRTPCC
jgi:hypothetical protein